MIIIWSIVWICKINLVLSVIEKFKIYPFEFLHFVQLINARVKIHILIFFFKLKDKILLKIKNEEV